MKFMLEVILGIAALALAWLWWSFAGVHFLPLH